MKHLTVDEIIAFVSFSEINKETLAAAAAVNSHILNCAACREKVEAYSLIHEKIVTSARSGGSVKLENEKNQMQKTEKNQMQKTEKKQMQK